MTIGFWESFLFLLPTFRESSAAFRLNAGSGRLHIHLRSFGCTGTISNFSWRIL